MSSRALAPLVLHLVYRFDTGGLENGVVNLINHMDPEAYRHAVIALTDVVPSFARRITRHDVVFESLHKPDGHALRVFPKLLGLMRSLRPAVVHSRNLAALECQPLAALAGVPVRVHGEHGRDADDPSGARRKYQIIRRAYRPFIHRYVALSRDLADYLQTAVGVPEDRISQIYNGVDQSLFKPALQRSGIEGCPFVGEGLCMVGTVGRMQTVKAQPLLARAFVQALNSAPSLRNHLRLILVGDGPLRAECETVLQDAGVRDLAWLPGERSDMPAVMRGLDLFVLPSLAEGISNTILEAMASGLPVIATNVGGNADLVDNGISGEIVSAGDSSALARALTQWAADPVRRRQAGAVGRAKVERRFSLQAMVSSYAQVYADQLAQASRSARPNRGRQP